MGDHLEVDAEMVGTLLEGSGWPCERITEDTWRSRIRVGHGAFPFLVRIEPEGYLVFAVVPYLKSPEDAERAAALYRRLLELNDDLLLAKFSIDDDLDVVLSVEYPTAALDRSEFDDALDVLSYYADLHYEELRAMG